MSTQYILRITRPEGRPFTHDITQTVDVLHGCRPDIPAFQRACDIWETVAAEYPKGAVELLTITPGRTVVTTAGAL